MTIKKKALPIGMAIGIGMNSIAAMGVGFSDSVKIEGNYDVKDLWGVQDYGQELVIKALDLIDQYEYNFTPYTKGLVVAETNILESTINRSRDNDIDIEKSIEEIEKHIKIVEDLIDVEDDIEDLSDLYEELLRIHTEELGYLHSIHSEKEDGFYTEKSWDELERVMDYSENILEDIDNGLKVDREKLEMAIEALNNAIFNLEEKNEKSIDNYDEENKIELKNRYESAKAAIDFSLIREDDLERYNSLEKDVELALNDQYELSRDEANILISKVESMSINLEEYVVYLKRLHMIIDDTNLEELEADIREEFIIENDYFGKLMNELASLDKRDNILGDTINGQIDKMESILTVYSDQYSEEFEDLKLEFREAVIKADKFLEYKDVFNYHNATVNNIRYQEKIANDIIDNFGSLKTLRNSISSILYDLELFEGDLERSFFILYPEFKNLVDEINIKSDSLDNKYNEKLNNYGIYFTNKEEIYRQEDRIEFLFNMNVKLLNSIEKLKSTLDSIPEVSDDDILLKLINERDRTDELALEEILNKVIVSKKLDLEVDENLVIGLNRYGRDHYKTLDEFIVDLLDKYDKKDLLGTLREIGDIVANSKKYELNKTLDLINSHDEAIFIIKNYSDKLVIESKDLEIKDLMKEIYNDRDKKIKEMQNNFNEFKSFLENKESYKYNDAFRRLENLYNERIGLENGDLQDIENVNANFAFLMENIELIISEDLEELEKKFYDIVESNVDIIDMKDQYKYTKDSFDKMIDLYDKLESLLDGDISKLDKKELSNLIDEFESSIKNLKLEEKEDEVVIEEKEDEIVIEEKEDKDSYRNTYVYDYTYDYGGSYGKRNNNSEKVNISKNINYKKNQKRLNEILGNKERISNKNKKTLSIVSKLANTFSGIQNVMSKIVIKTLDK